MIMFLDIIDDMTSELSSTEESDVFNFLTNASKIIEKSDVDDLWTPKKIIPYISTNEDSLHYSQVPYVEQKPTESFSLVVPRIRILFEIEAKDRIPLLMIKSTIDVSIQDWSKQMHGKCEITLISTYYNEKFNTWEPLIEPVLHDDNVCSPWTLIIKLFQVKYFFNYYFRQYTLR